MKTAVIYIIIGVLGSAIGQVLLKRGMNNIGTVTLSLNQLPAILWQMVTNLNVFIGLIIYLGSVIFWLAALSRVDLSYAYPFASLSYLIVLVASWVLLNEKISPFRLIGTVVIGIGVLLIYRF